jgi:hypothetical protein
VTDTIGVGMVGYAFMGKAQWHAFREAAFHWRFIDSVAARIDDAALREARAKDAVRACELVYKALGGE